MAKKKNDIDVKALKKAGELAAKKSAMRYADMYPSPKKMAGVLIAEGDSWFDFPTRDVLKKLKRKHGYKIHSAARHGHTLESMAYDQDQHDGLYDAYLDAAGGDTPKAVLISGGGNDVVGDEFFVLLNHANSGKPPVNQAIVDEMVNHRLKAAMIRLLSLVTSFNDHIFADPKIPIIVHGYDYPFPDGRKALWVAGPWMHPAFKKKGFDVESDLDVRKNRKHVITMLDQYNDMLKDLNKISGFEHVHYVNLRGTLKLKDYKQEWADELHATHKGLNKLAKKFDTAIKNAQG